MPARLPQGPPASPRLNPFSLRTVATQLYTGRPGDGNSYFPSQKEKLRGGWVQSANFASKCARKLLIL